MSRCLRCGHQIGHNYPNDHGECDRCIAANAKADAKQIPRDPKTNSPDPRLEHNPTVIPRKVREVRMIR